MKCERCKSDRILQVDGKVSDMCGLYMHGEDRPDGYVPQGLNIGGGDYLVFKVCLDCGQMAGTWPVSDPEFLDDY